LSFLKYFFVEYGPQNAARIQLFISL